MSGTEGAHHFLQVPQMLTKSMEYHYPAEFIVPTNMGYDIGPIGNAFETEFEQQELPVGLRVADLLEGVLVAGGTATQRFQLNAKIVSEAAIAEENYLIITTDHQWRRFLDLNKQTCAVLRLGADLTLNPLDAEGADTIEHVATLSQAFAQAFYLSRLGQESLLESLVALFEGSRADAVAPDFEALKASLESRLTTTRGTLAGELGMVFQALLNMGYGPLSRIFGKTNIPLDQFMNGVTIIELEPLPQQDLQFVILCLLVKLLSYSKTHPQRATILLDSMDLLMPHNPFSAKARDTEHYLLDWLQRFKTYNKGLHFSFQTPSRAPPILLNAFPTTLAFKITSEEDVKAIGNSLQLLPDRLVHSRERHDNYQVEFLKTMSSDMCILKRADFPNPFPIRIMPPDFTRTHLAEVSELQERVQLFFPTWEAPQVISRVALERNFSGRDVLLAQRILSLLQEYPTLGTTGLFSSLGTSPEMELELVDLEGVLNRLVQLNYLAVIERDDGRGHSHKSYQLKDRGSDALREYLEELDKRLAQA